MLPKQSNSNETTGTQKFVLTVFMIGFDLIFVSLCFLLLSFLKALSLFCFSCSCLFLCAVLVVPSSSLQYFFLYTSDFLYGRFSCLSSPLFCFALDLWRSSSCAVSQRQTSLFPHHERIFVPTQPTTSETTRGVLLFLLFIWFIFLFLFLFAVVLFRFWIVAFVIFLFIFHSTGWFSPSQGEASSDLRPHCFSCWSQSIWAPASGLLHLRSHYRSRSQRIRRSNALPVLHSHKLAWSGVVCTIPQGSSWISLGDMEGCSNSCFFERFFIILSLVLLWSALIFIFALLLLFHLTPASSWSYYFFSYPCSWSLSDCFRFDVSVYRILTWTMVFLYVIENSTENTSWSGSIMWTPASFWIIIHQSFICLLFFFRSC